MHRCKFGAHRNLIYLSRSINGDSSPPYILSSVPLSPFLSTPGRNHKYSRHVMPGSSFLVLHFSLIDPLFPWLYITATTILHKILTSCYHILSTQNSSSCSSSDSFNGCFTYLLMPRLSSHRPARHSEKLSRESSNTGYSQTYLLLFFLFFHSLHPIIKPLAWAFKRLVRALYNKCALLKISRT